MGEDTRAKALSAASEPVSVAGRAKLRAALDRLIANSGYLTGCEQMNARLLATLDALERDAARESQPDVEALREALKAEKASVLRESWPDGWEPVDNAALGRILARLAAQHPDTEAVAARIPSKCPACLHSIELCAADTCGCPVAVALAAVDGD